MIRVGVIGCGQWGPNHIRVFSQLENASVVMCADKDEGRLDAVRQLYPSIELVQDYQKVIHSQDIHAVVVALPTKFHEVCVREALVAGKHVLCEKPLALDADVCRELHQLAQEKKRVLMVGHIFLFNPAIQFMKKMIDNQELGCIYYAHSERTNLGPFRYDVNALWDLAPHDISIFHYLFGGKAKQVSARGMNFLGDTLEDVTFANLTYDDNRMVNIHVSWLDPRKVRQITIVGDKKMLVWDDLDVQGPIKIYDKRVEKTDVYYNTYGEFQLLSKEGSITIPSIKMSEPLKVEAQYFIDCIKGSVDASLTDGNMAADVTAVLSAIQDSMQQRGAEVVVS